MTIQRSSALECFVFPRMHKIRYFSLKIVSVISCAIPVVVFVFIAGLTQNMCVTLALQHTDVKSNTLDAASCTQTQDHAAANNVAQCTQGQDIHGSEACGEMADTCGKKAPETCHRPFLLSTLLFHPQYLSHSPSTTC